MHLDEAQLQEYREDGFVASGNVFSAEEIQVLHSELSGVLAEGGPDVVVEEDQTTVRMVHGLHLRPGRFCQLSRHPRLVKTAERLLESGVYVYQSRLNLKPPWARNSAAGYPWHQDFATWYARDGLREPRAVVTFTFLDEVSACNAPLLVIPKSHRAGLVEHDRQKGERYAEIPPRVLRQLGDQGGVAAQLGPPGSVLFMHCGLVHGSTENISPLRRAMYSVIYCAVDNQPTRLNAPERYAPRDFHPVTPVPDDCLLTASADG